jgi:hypothetical protein
MNGVNRCKSKMEFEKDCVMLKMGAVYTQIGAKQDRMNKKGIDSEVDSLLRDEGKLRYIYENLNNEKRMDIGKDMMDMI